MRYITEKEYEQRMIRIKRKNDSIQRKQKIRAEEDKYKHKLSLPSTSKLMAVYLFVVFNAVLIYAMVAMWTFGDLNYLGVLITDIAGQVLTYFIYAKKSTAENTQGGLVYDSAMERLKNELFSKEETDEDVSG